jgi:hypothetical protein
MPSWRRQQGQLHLLHCVINPPVKYTKVDQERDGKPNSRMRIEITDVKRTNFFNDNNYNTKDVSKLGALIAVQCLFISE